MQMPWLVWEGCSVEASEAGGGGEHPRHGWLAGQGWSWCLPHIIKLCYSLTAVLLELSSHCEPQPHGHHATLSEVLSLETLGQAGLGLLYVSGLVSLA